MCNQMKFWHYLFIPGERKYNKDFNFDVLILSSNQIFFIHIIFKIMDIKIKYIY